MDASAIVKSSRRHSVDQRPIQLRLRPVVAQLVTFKTILSSGRGVIDVEEAVFAEMRVNRQAHQAPLAAFSYLKLQNRCRLKNSAADSTNSSGSFREEV